MFKRWAHMMGKPELVHDPRFEDDKARGENGQVLSDLMAQWCSQFTREEALAHLEEARIPAGPVQSPRQALDDPMVKASEALHWITYPGVDEPFPIIAPPVLLSRTPPRIERRPPTSGEHTDEVLRAMGYCANAIAGLRAQGVV